MSQFRYFIVTFARLLALGFLWGYFQQIQPTLEPNWHGDVSPIEAQAGSERRNSLLGFGVMIGTNLFYGICGVRGCWFAITLAIAGDLHILKNLLFAAIGLLSSSNFPPSAPVAAQRKKANRNLGNQTVPLTGLFEAYMFKRSTP